MDVEPYLCLICFAIAMNASSTPTAVFAEVSSSGMSNWAANSWNVK